MGTQWGLSTFFDMTSTKVMEYVTGFLQHEASVIETEIGTLQEY